MWSSDRIEIDLQEVDGATALIRIATPIGAIDMIGEVRFVGRSMRIDRVHIDGPGPGVLGRRGLNAIGSKLLVVADADEIIIQGSVRTTGRNKGRKPKTIRYRRASAP